MNLAFEKHKHAVGGSAGLDEQLAGLETARFHALGQPVDRLRRQIGQGRDRTKIAGQTGKSFTHGYTFARY